MKGAIFYKARNEQKFPKKYKTQITTEDLIRCRIVLHKKAPGQDGFKNCVRELKKRKTTQFFLWVYFDLINQTQERMTVKEKKRIQINLTSKPDAAIPSKISEKYKNFCL